MKFKHEPLICWGSTPEEALTKLLDLPCIKNDKQEHSLNELYVLSYSIPRTRIPRPKIPSVFGSGCYDAFLEGSSSAKSKRKQLLPEEELERNRIVSGNCAHGVPVEECPKCASWGTNFSGTREFD